ncbi:MAG: hypothetical protein CM1200mP39_23260 [Dehalococcoidia bacterium]|nr:MAG: hypothetical protein CM1200mP39_23260 [Dehalococcoidia bacterium]
MGWFAMFVATLILPRRGASSFHRSVLRDLGTGFGFIFRNRVLLVFMILAFANMLMVFGWIGVLPAYVDLFGGGAREVGFMFSSAGIGAFSGILVAGKVSSGRYMGWMILGGAASFSAIMLAVSNSPSIVMAMVLAAVAHFGNGLFNISLISRFNYVFQKISAVVLWVCLPSHRALDYLVAYGPVFCRV